MAPGCGGIGTYGSTASDASTRHSGRERRQCGDFVDRRRLPYSAPPDRSIGEIAFGSVDVAPPKAASSRIVKYSATSRLDVGSRSSTVSTPRRAMCVGHDHARVDRKCLTANEPLLHAPLLHAAGQQQRFAQGINNSPACDRP